MSPDFQRLLHEADRLLRHRQPQAAETVCAKLLAEAPVHRQALLILSRARQMQNDWDGMLAHVDMVLKAEPGDLTAQLMRAEALSALGEIRKARLQLKTVKRQAIENAGLLGRIAEMETQLGDHPAARETLAKAHALAPDDPAILYNLASAEIAVGEMDSAEKLLDQLIETAPGDYDACYNRATVRRQTLDNNHIDDLMARLARVWGNVVGEIQLCYALAKELEDIGEYDRAFAYLSRGADARRRQMAYRVEDDISTMEDIATVFDEGYFAGYGDGSNGEGAIFILGLPRSGTTLVDRILSSHPDVKSVGEVNDLALAITRLCSGAKSKEELVRRSAAIDPNTLSVAYRNSTTQRLPDSPYIIDKTPLNFLYIGLIAKTMPAARIINLVRDPMDVGYAMYKTLFRMGYPFSYDLEDIGRYICAKDRLMAHWEAVLPGKIINVDYQQLVTRQEGESRKLVSALGLEWHPDCLAFHQNKSPSATASAAQVRQPIYSSSVGKWKRYENQLAPLAKILKT
jgi:tetratricopeptide (TPR) repeat protein